ncbi:alpha/beta-hydrolase [Cucurbitaria berberidis CBS 394.84]|uniref:Alpha/beta-hydrolase n=1 Tax=Cucurbitaria berberidis CBS 394.84 TaxID=1168544 RepID=A0A9P4GN78_9PLEO|nr:alpha/beta-hydrolase [Cucurbitaria berberidis CBS 394.84]KAF1848670.1 alpha/beta-hydrolase [Cucurbitaria berberidis CBS 394.84]
MASISAHKIQDDKFNSLGLTKLAVNEEQVTSYSRALGTASEKNPILVLVHGYPQSAYMWRHLIPLLPQNAPIFAPDLPGYGTSAAIQKNDKLTIGNAILAALMTEIKRTSSGSSTSNIPVVLIGHDRGARVLHHLAVSGVEGVNILGVCLIDIVPTSTQWQRNASPVDAAKEVTGYFHWPFLANVSLAVRMITAFGASNWCEEMILHWAGKNPSGLDNLKADDALTVYGEFLSQPHSLKASCEDYREGATTDVERDQQNQKEGKRIKSPLLLLYSADYIGSRYKFPDVWKDWVDNGVEIQHHSFGDGIGHFGAEEAPQEAAKVINAWLTRLGVNAAS